MNARKLWMMLLTVLLITMSILPNMIVATENNNGTEATNKVALSEAVKELHDNVMAENSIQLESEDATENEQATETQSEEKENVRVIIEYEEDSVLETFNKNKKNIGKAAKKELENAYSSASKSHKEFTNQAKAKGLAIKYKHKYKTAFNGASAEVKRKDIKAIKELPQVKEVHLVKEYELDMNNATKLTNVPHVWDGEENGLGSDFRGEGMLIAVIDSGIDPTHRDLVLSEGMEKKLSNEADLARVVQELPEDSEFKDLTLQWFTDKVPTGYNWADQNHTIWETSNLGSNHGTHVAGIIGANGNVEEGGIKGVAPEAQLVSQKVLTNNPLAGGIYSDDILAAINHSVAIGADVINMSLGSSAAFNIAEGGPEYTAMKNAADSGVIVIKSAGNSSNYANTNTANDTNHPLAQNPDNGVSDPTYGETVIAASLNNTTVTDIAFEYKHGEQKQLAAYFPADTPDIKEFIGLENNFELVYAGFGSKQDLSKLKHDLGIDLKGKILLIKRGHEPDDIDSRYFYTKVGNAQEEGAAAVLVLNDEGTGERLTKMGFSSFRPQIPAVLVGHEAGKSMLELGGLAIGEDSEPGELGMVEGLSVAFGEQFMTGPNTEANTMADSSTWGATSDLGFYPDITAPGGSIWSLKNGDQYQSMSGTSMAAPHITGVSALVYEAFKEKYDLAPTELADAVKMAIMNTAEPVIDAKNELPYLTRKQGAGLTKADNAVKTPAVATRKVALKDFVEREKEFSITLKNLSDSTVSYEYQATAVLTDETYEKDGRTYSTTRAGVVDGAELQLLSVNGAGVSDATVEVGPKSTVELTFKLANLPDLGELTAQNPGIFVEGFISLVPTDETHPKLSVPYMGFYGDWSLPKTVDAHFSEEDSYHKMTGLYSITSGNTIAKLGYDYDNKVYNQDEVAMSNHPEYSTTAGPVLTFLRNAKEVEVNVYAGEKQGEDFVKGDLVRTLSQDYFLSKNYSRGQLTKYSYYGTWMWEGAKYNPKTGSYNYVEDGHYLYEVKTKLDIADEGWQVDEFVIKVDSVQPEINGVTAEVLEDGNVELSWNAQDNENGSGIAGYHIVLNDNMDDSVQVRPSAFKNGKYILNNKEFSKEGEYRFNVIAFDKAGNGSYLPVEKQPVVTIGDVPQQENLILDEAIEDVNYTAEREYEFSYSLSENVQGVNIQVFAETGITLLDVNNGKNTSYKIEGLKKGYNTVRVAPLNKFGYEYPNQAQEFRVMVDQDLPTVAINQPRSGSTYFTKDIRLQGAILNASPIKTFTVGGQDIPLNELKRFDSVIRVEDDGVLKLPVVAEDIVGNKVEFQLPVTVDTTAPELSIDDDSDKLMSTVVPENKETYLLKGSFYDETSRVALYVNSNNVGKISLEEAQSGESKAFEHEIPLEMGKNVVSVELIDIAGNAYVKQFVVVRGEGELPELSLRSLKISKDTVSHQTPLVYEATGSETLNWKVKVVKEDGKAVDPWTFADKLQIKGEWLPEKELADGNYRLLIEGESEDGRKLETFTHNFKVYNSPLEIKNVQLTDMNGEEKASYKKGDMVLIKADIGNYSKEKQQGEVVFQVKDKKGDVINIGTMSYSGDHDTTAEARAGFSLPKNAKKGEYTVQVYLWDSFSTKKDLSSPSEVKSFKVR